MTTTAASDDDGTTLLRERLKQAQTAIEPYLRAAVERLEPPVRAIASYHFGWTDVEGRPNGSASGRRRLGMITLVSGSLDGTDCQQALTAAVACELAFNAALIHDDIADGDRTRRGRPAAWTVFGSSEAMLTGVSLTGLAFDVLADGPAEIVPAAVRRLSHAVTSLTAGQVSDIAFERRINVTYEDYLAMVQRKAGAFVSCGCALGALFAGAEHTEGLARFGSSLGLVWQLRNDLLGIWGEPDRTGKNALSDVQARKKTFPVIAALSTTGRHRDELAGLYLRAGDEPLTPQEAAHAVALIERCGGRRRTEEETRLQLQAAVDSLDTLVPDDGTRADLAAIASFFAHSER